MGSGSKDIALDSQRPEGLFAQDHLLEDACGYFRSMLYFSVIAQEKSFSRAAERLGVTQSTMSHLVRNLERKLGTRLLARNARGATVTREGQMLLETLVPGVSQIMLSLQLHRK